MGGRTNAMLLIIYLELHDEMCEVELRLQVESDADVL